MIYFATKERKKVEWVSRPFMNVRPEVEVGDE